MRSKVSQADVNIISCPFCTGKYELIRRGANLAGVLHITPACAQFVKLGLIPFLRVVADGAKCI